MTKAAIVYLVHKKETGKVESLCDSLIHLDRYFNCKYRYPVLIFHEDYTEKEFESLRKITSFPLEFVELKDFNKLPSYPGLTQEQVDRWIEGKDGGRIGARLGYRQMCRFYSYTLFHHQALSDFDYYWRFDDDSFLLDEVKEDPFELMEKKGYVYGYRSVEFENPKTVGIGLDVLWKKTKEFAKKNKLSLSSLKKRATNWKGRYTGLYYYNNFEINKVSFWREHTLYSNYFSFLDKSLGFFQYRWGDSHVRLFANHLFLKPHQIHHFDQIPYRHNDHYSFPNSEEVHYIKKRTEEKLPQIFPTCK